MRWEAAKADVRVPLPMTGGAPIRVVINGAAGDSLSSLDRGLLYGDGLFETLAISDGRPRFWARHMYRLREGCRRLAIPFPDEPGLLEECREAIRGMERGVLKLILTRGPGGRGYRMPEDPQPTRIIQCHPWAGYAPELAGHGVSVRLCKQRLGCNPLLAGIKHLNRLEQVLARREWTDAGIMEGLQCDIDDNLIEGTMSNLFLVRDGSLFTPDLSRCGVAGIMRSVVMELAGKLPVPVITQALALADLRRADEVFLTNSLIGIWPVAELGGVALRTGPLTRRLQNALASLQAEGETWYA